MRPGELVKDRYRLIEKVGSGGSGVVWHAFDERLGRDVALKHVLTPADQDDIAEQGNVLRHESTHLATINHPNVITVFDTVFEAGVWWLVMEYAPGSDLTAERELSVEAIARYGAQLASGLAAVHAKNIVHRDIKPANVVITADDRAKLTDFGISRRIHGDVTAVTNGAFLVGTPGYMAPEVANGAAPDPAADVFSLGATLFRVLEGVTPFGPADDQGLVWRNTLTGRVAEPTGDTPLAPVLTELLRVPPELRPTAARARELLDAVATGTRAATSTTPTTGNAAAPATGHSTPRSWRRARRPVLTAGALVTVGLLAIALWRFDPFGWASGTDRSEHLSVVGDPRTADPCALTDAAALSRFGAAQRDPEYGNFDRCDVLVQSGDSEVDVRVELRTPDSDETAPGPVQTVGRVGVVRDPLNGESCERTLLLADGNHVQVLARQLGEGPADLCAMADSATDSAVAKLAQGQSIPPRPGMPAASLINADACALLDNEGLSRFPGVDATDPDPGFANWSCRWHSTTSAADLLVRFDRHPPLTAADGRPVELAGHRAFVEPDGYGPDTCQVSVPHREYVGEISDRAELLLVVVSGPQPADQLCQLATSLAEPAAANLPPR